MKIYAKCSCGYTEELNKDLILKIIGGVITTGGFGAWVTFFFAGTGFALPICIALVIGGAAIMAYSTEIAIWLSERYECPNCGKKEWEITHK